MNGRGRWSERVEGWITGVRSRWKTCERESGVKEGKGKKREEWREGKRGKGEVEQRVERWRKWWRKRKEKIGNSEEELERKIKAKKRKRK